MDKLIKIQQELKAPKNQKNNFGGYSYRSCEDILNAVKPLLLKYEVVLNITDKIISVEEDFYKEEEKKEEKKEKEKEEKKIIKTSVKNRIYIEAIASLYNNDGKLILSSTGLAREEMNKKGMDASQITGAASSYARKYALNGLFAIDDNKDADFTNNTLKQAVKLGLNIKPNTPEGMFLSLIRNNPLKDNLITEWDETEGDLEKQRNLLKRVKNKGE